MDKLHTLSDASRPRQRQAKLDQVQQQMLTVKQHIKNFQAAKAKEQKVFGQYPLTINASS